MAPSKEKSLGRSNKVSLCKPGLPPLLSVEGKPSPCTSCHAAHARLCCAYCTGPAPPQLPTSPRPSPNYCSKKCQTDAWPLHKPECKRFQQRLAIFRIAGLVQGLFDLWCEVFYSFNIRSVQVEDDRVFVYGSSDGSAFTRNGSIGNPLPGSKVLPEAWKGAVLAFLFRDDALAFFWGILESLFQGYDVTIEELVVKLHHTDRRIILVNQHGHYDADKLSHHILRVSLNDGEAFVIDLNGAQYSFSETIVPWETYDSQRSCEMLEVKDFGHAISSLHELHHSRTRQSSSYDPAWEMKAGMMMTIDRAFRDHSLQADLKTTMQRSTEADYAAIQDFILTTVLSTMIIQIESPQGLTIAVDAIVQCDMALCPDRPSLNLKDLLLKSRAMHEKDGAPRVEQDTKDPATAHTEAPGPPIDPSTTDPATAHTEAPGPPIDPSTTDPTPPNTEASCPPIVPSTSDAEFWQNKIRRLVSDGAPRKVVEVADQAGAEQKPKQTQTQRSWSSLFTGSKP